MELELGVALIPAQKMNPIKGFDFGRNRNRNGKELCLGSKFDHGNNYKRSLEEAFYEEGAAGGKNGNVKLSMLCWNGQPNEEDDDGKEERKGTSFTTDENEEKGNYVVGWPPINSWRKNLWHRQQGATREIMNDRTVERGSHGGSNSRYVEFKIEGSASRKKDRSTNVFILPKNFQTR